MNDNAIAIRLDCSSEKIVLTFVSSEKLVLTLCEVSKQLQNTGPLLKVYIRQWLAGSEWP